MPKDKKENSIEIVIEKLDVVKDICLRIEASEDEASALKEETIKQGELLRQLKSENVGLAAECSASHDRIEALAKENDDLKEEIKLCQSDKEFLEEQLQIANDEIRRLKATKKPVMANYRRPEEKREERRVSGFRIKGE